ncbi:hypothetical protein HZY83_07650 [Gemella sp. GH3]|uniref:hypothetical protein n=1 Tax=unclassified Gemella TaxID=2624949 RepID=UPI0015D07F55|nr:MULTISPECIES: hypothetical protein [unclassified Gemella]MBF0714549.1 hypothetical protein [Gemella sp. GH3.1]NYS51501.1 hypothetical protein [Gemella sp. GH3]
MKKTTLDKNILLGGIVSENDNYQVVHMNLKSGNQTDNYSNDKNIIIFNISGKITVATEDTVEMLNEFEMLEIEKNNMHVITCLQDAQVIVVKL